MAQSHERTEDVCSRQNGGRLAAVKIRPLAIDGAYEITPQQHTDSRGVFLEWFKATTFRDAVGRDLELAQANCSVSAAGVIRGIHFSDVPPGQAKYITCISGAVLDVVVDVRVGSPTFGTWDSVLLDDTDRRGTFIEEGLGHAFMSLVEGSTVVYLCSTPYAPGREHGVHPLDPAIGIEWPQVGRDGAALAHVLAEKDAAAPTLSAAVDGGVLPRLDAVDQWRAQTGSS
jgi:dTDP-4-dehydrorhamnose 3,5-epimerase